MFVPFNLFVNDLIYFSRDFEFFQNYVLLLMNNLNGKGCIKNSKQLDSVLWVIAVSVSLSIRFLHLENSL